MSKTDQTNSPGGQRRPSPAETGDDDADVTVYKRAVSHPRAADDDEPLSEREEMARIMSSLREQIPYQDEDGTPASKSAESTDEDFARLLRNLKATIPDDPEPPPLPMAPKRPQPAKPVPIGDTSEESFTQLLRNLRETIPDDPETDTILDDDDADEVDYTDNEQSAGLNTIGTPQKASTQLAAAKPAIPEPARKTETDSIEVGPGEAAVIADLLRSMHDSAPRQPTRPVLTVGRDDDETAHDDDDGFDRWQIWKIGLVLGGAAALGLVIALVNPFGEPVSTSVASRVVVPMPSSPVTEPESPKSGGTSVVIPLPPPVRIPTPPIVESRPVPSVAPPPPAEPVEPPPAPAPVAAPPPPPAPVPVAAPPPPPAPVPVAAPPPPPAPVPVAAPPPPPAPIPVAAPPPPPVPVPVAAPPPPPAPVLARVTPPPPEPIRLNPPPPPAAASPRTAAVSPPAAPVVVPPPQPRPKPASEPPPPAHQPTPVAGPPNKAPPKAITPAPLILEPPRLPVGPSFHTVQIGSFKLAENADSLVARLTKRHFEAYSKDWTDRTGELWHVVRVGRLSDRTSAEALAETIAAEFNLNTVVLVGR